MEQKKPSLFGIVNSNRNFSDFNSWGKNQFNSSFPASLACYLHSRGIKAIYLISDAKANVVHSEIAIKDLFGIDPLSANIYFSFETQYMPYQQYTISHLPRVDLVIQDLSKRQHVRALEVKLTALPDQTTFSLTDHCFGTELVVRPDTIVYLACSLAELFKNKRAELCKVFNSNIGKIKNWADENEMLGYLPVILKDLDKLIETRYNEQVPLILQPIWKTKGKVPNLADNCLDIFVWSNFGFLDLFLNVVKQLVSADCQIIKRPMRAVVWLYKMLYDFSATGKFNHKKTIDELSYNTKNDKAFALSGAVTHRFMKCDRLTNPIIKKSEIKDIIIDGGQDLLSPERRFDAIICNTPGLFGGGNGS